MTPEVPRLAVEPVLMFKASCFCGWWKIEATETDAQVAVIQHRACTRCDSCGDLVDHDEVYVLDQGDWVGVFCGVCAPSYRAEPRRGLS